MEHGSDYHHPLHYDDVRQYVTDESETKTSGIIVKCCKKEEKKEKRNS